MSERSKINTMKEKLAQIKAEALKQIEDSGQLDKLNEIRVNYLGKKGQLTAVLKGMKDVAPEDRPKVGQKSRRCWKPLNRRWKRHCGKRK